MLDMTTDFGRRVARRLEQERIIWLTTVSPGGAPLTQTSGCGGSGDFSDLQPT